ncbi:MAG TPA: deoxyribonuclease IV [Terriglobales bacterium]
MALLYLAMPLLHAPSPTRNAKTAPRCGAHISGGVGKSLEGARALACDCLQIFTASPRQWKASPIPPDRAAAFRAERAASGLRPLVVHANYLINLAGANSTFHTGSLTAFRGELERAIAIGAEYLVLHPGSGDVVKCVDSIRAASRGLDWGSLQLLIENTPGAGQHLGGSFGQLGEILAGLDGLPVGVCIDTCHAWVAGYDLVSAKGYAAAMDELHATVGLGKVPVFHCNDAKADRASHRDRHEHIGEGKLGKSVFRRLLRDPRLRAKAFILETPIDGPDAQARDLACLRQLAGR